MKITLSYWRVSACSPAQPSCDHRSEFQYPTRPVADPQASGLRSLGGTLARSVQHQLRRAGFDRIVIYGYLSGLSRPEQVVHFFRNVVGVAVIDKEVFSRRTADYQAWVEAFARNHRLPIEWAEKGVRKEDHVLPWQRRMDRASGSSRARV